MKKHILSVIIVLAILLSALAGCGIPKETGKLVIYSPDNNYSSLLNPALDIFRELYPEIEVSYQIYEDDEYQEMIREEIPAGKGPDLVLFTSKTFPDIYKTMSSGVLEDLNKYFKKDDEILLTDFIEPVMDGGVLKGRRYLVPLSYEMPFILTTESILEEIGMIVDEIKTCDGFSEGAVRFREKYPDSTLFMDMCGGYNPCVSDILSLYRNFGFDFIDHKTNKVQIDEARFRQCMNLVKLYYDPDYDVTDESKIYEIDFYNHGAGLLHKLFPYDDLCASSYALYRDSSKVLRSEGEEPVMFLQGNQHDGITAELGICAAIPKRSENKSNAWKLLKILLSEEIQGGHDKERWNSSYIWGGYPVRLSSTKAALDMGRTRTPNGREFDEFVALVQSPTEAVIIPPSYRLTVNEQFMPYIEGEKTWDECYESFIDALNTYRKSK